MSLYKLSATLPDGWLAFPVQVILSSSARATKGKALIRAGEQVGILHPGGTILIALIQRAPWLNALHIIPGRGRGPAWTDGKRRARGQVPRTLGKDRAREGKHYFDQVVNCLDWLTFFGPDAHLVLKQRRRKPN